MARIKHATDGSQLPLFRPKGDWRPTPLSQIPNWKGAKRVGLDIETYDPTLLTLGPGPRRSGKIVGVSFAIEDGPAHYLPMRHAGGDNLDPDQVLAYLKEQAKTFTGSIVGANLSYDLDFLTHEGIWFGEIDYFRDVMLADPLIYELHMSYSLQKIAERWNLPGKDQKALEDAAMSYGVKAKSGLHQLPARFVAEYAIQDAVLPLKILRKQERVIEEQDLWGVYNLECKVLPVLVKLQARGVRIDLDKLLEVEQWCMKQEREALDQIKHSTGIEVPVDGVWKAKLLAKVLEHVGVTIKKTKTGAPNIDKNVLENLDHPVAEHIGWARKVNKLRTTFAASIRSHIVGDRIHCGFNQLARASDDGEGIKGARFGRLSSEHPNMQQQPSRDEFAAMWRSIYVPNHKDQLWACLDYSQQEPRVLTHFAVKAGCNMAQEAADRYINDPNTDNHQMMAELTGLKRKAAKVVYLALCYGMGGAKLARDLGLGTKFIKHRKSGRMIEVADDAAQEIIFQFNAKAPYVKEMAYKCSKLAGQRGYIKTLSGRRCRFPQDEAGNFDWTHKALNRLIQGSSADQTKMAMVAADAAGHKLQLQVHDELDLSVDNIGQAEEIADIMRNCVDLLLPTKVDVETGPSWGEIK